MAGGMPRQRASSGARIPKQVRVDALVRHREYEHEHGPGYSRGVTGDRYSAKRTPEEWGAPVESIRNEGVREPLHFHFAHNPKEHAGYLVGSTKNPRRPPWTGSRKR
jgi:hypothetical protein